MHTLNGWQITEQLDDVGGRFSPESENSIFRIIQESLNNISKHAAASAVTLRMKLRDEVLEILIEDNGCGFDPNANPAGSGLHNIRERVRLLKGKVTIESVPGKGTKLCVNLPCRPLRHQFKERPPPTMTLSPQSVSVLLADDPPVFLQGLRQALEADERFHVVAECRNGQTALEQVRQHQPQLAVLDIDMPLVDGFRIAERMTAEGLPTKVVFLTVHNEASFLKRALQLGALGYILKDSAPAQIVDGLRAVSENNLYISSAMARYLSKRPDGTHQATFPAADVEADLSGLTPTERTVLMLIGECRSTKEIAELLHISPRTVDTHRARISKKLRLSGNHSLTKFVLIHRDKL